MEKQPSKRKIIIQKAVFAALAVCAALLTGFLLRESSWWLYFGLIIGSSLLAVTVVVISAQRFAPVYKITLTIIALVLAYVVLHITLKYTGLLEYIDSAEKIQALIQATGGWGIFVFFLITLLQVIVLPIPMAVTVVAGAVAFGSATISFLVSTAGTLVGSVICFFLGRKFGKKLAVWIAGEEKTEKYTTIIATKGKIPFLAMMLFPFFPDDLLCIVAGTSKMSFWFFFVAIVITRPVMIAIYSYFGDDSLLAYDFWGIFLRVVIFVGFMALLLVFKLVWDRITKLRNEKRKSHLAEILTQRPVPAETAEDTVITPEKKKPEKETE